MASSHLLLDAQNVIRGAVDWDGTSPYQDPPGIARRVPWPQTGPEPREGDSYDDGTQQVRPRPDTPEEQRQTTELALRQGLDANIAELTQIVNQTTAYQQKAPYTTANLAALNDLLASTKQLADAVGTLAKDVRGIARLIARRFD